MARDFNPNPNNPDPHSARHTGWFRGPELLPSIAVHLVTPAMRSVLAVHLCYIEEDQTKTIDPALIELGK